jgi:hypothetical protein
LIAAPALAPLPRLPAPASPAAAAPLSAAALVAPAASSSSIAAPLSLPDLPRPDRAGLLVFWAAPVSCGFPPSCFTAPPSTPARAIFCSSPRLGPCVAAAALSVRAASSIAAWL